MFKKYILIHKSKFNINTTNKYLTTKIRSEQHEKYTSVIHNLFSFKRIINKLLEEKIFHFCVLNEYEQNINELVSLQKMTKTHQKILFDILSKMDYNKNQLSFEDEKATYMNYSTMLLNFKVFSELMKFLHEKKEEQINNLIREILQNNNKEDNFLLNKTLIQVRDEWREIFSPEILDLDAKPINPLSYIETLNLEINKQVLIYLI